MMGRDEWFLKGGFGINLESKWTQDIRLVVDDESKRELSEFPSILSELSEAIKKASEDDVIKCEEKLAILFEKELTNLEAVSGISLKIEYKMAAEIDEILSVFDKIRQKAAMKAIVPEIDNLCVMLKGLVEKTKNMWERTGDFVQNIQTRNINMSAQIGAIRKLLTPMVLLARQQRKLTAVLLDFAGFIQKLEIEITEVEQGNRPEELGRVIVELKKQLAKFDSNLKDEFDALVNLRLYSLYMVMVVSMHIHGAIVQLHQLLQAGFSKEKEKFLEDRLQGLQKKMMDFEQRFVWLEQSCYQEVSKVFEHAAKEDALLKEA